MTAPVNNQVKIAYLEQQRKSGSHSPILLALVILGLALMALSLLVIPICLPAFPVLMGIGVSIYAAAAFPFMLIDAQLEQQIKELKKHQLA